MEENKKKNLMRQIIRFAFVKAEGNVIFGGRLGDYKYYDMDKVIEAALNRLETME